MDLRIIKTKKNIKEVFIELRRDQPLEKIRVATICQQALINKSTFYRYYTDVYDLSDQLQQEALDEASTDFKNLKKMFTSIDDFIEALSQLRIKNPEIGILFRGQEDRLIAMAQERIEKLYLTKDMEERSKISIAFIVGGIVYAYKGIFDGSYSEEEFRKVASQTVKFFATLIRE
ncbi:TetR/AcrR family transcriptional regulator [Ligilactobacillus animalis]|nr:TetR/AcrR family transcriptional regulator [Ligilactobacillus animalis]